MKRITNWNRIVLVMALGVLIGIGAGPAGALQEVDEPEGHRGFMAAKGRVSYRVYCSNCHGPDARGKGNLAQYLTVTPSDLTRLSAENEGRFPEELLVEVIDGRRPVRGHGGKEMPVWGDVFQHSLSETIPAGDETGEERARRKIRELVLYIETIQSTASAPTEDGER